MSTVQTIYNSIQYRPDIKVEADDLIHVVNMAVRAIAKRLYVLESSLITDQMEVSIFAEVKSYELLTLDVAPGTAWAVGDTVTGVTSGATCEIVEVKSTTTFIVKDRSGTFTLDEVLSNGTYTADQGAANPTCVSSMAFVDSGPDTITDANSQFVEAGFAADMMITTTHASNPGPFRIATVAAGTLTLAATDAVVAAVGSSFLITSDDSVGYLPSDFWGLADKPCISGKKYPLLPLPSVDTALQYTTGDPLFYKVKGTRIYVTPHTGSDYTIIADYFVKPTELTATTDTVPFNELFDDLIAEYIMRYFRGKPTQVEALLLKDMINDGVDLVASKYDKCAAPTPSGISWSNVE
ncbi:MAG: hypothetical protein PHF57_05430 [Methanoregula sp.]|nr:hypothetical protein [Methanoregula sp.]